tara:strand:+ start:604 stop:864 length:261 start_codon:yes stop_codon:yes gene_type:complete
MSTKNKQELPDWFNGTLYKEGNTVHNRFTKEPYELNNIELSMYDFVMGATMMIELGYRNEKVLTDHRKGLRWFQKNNIEAYMVLLD